MARMTVEDVYSGGKYNIMAAVTTDYFKNGRPVSCDERTWLTLLTVKYTLAIAEKMKQEGDSISTVVEDESSSPFVRWDYDDDAG